MAPSYSLVSFQLEGLSLAFLQNVVVMNFLSFCLSKNVFITPSFLKACQIQNSQSTVFCLFVFFLHHFECHPTALRHARFLLRLWEQEAEDPFTSEVLYKFLEGIGLIIISKISSLHPPSQYSSSQSIQAPTSSALVVFLYCGRSLPTSDLLWNRQSVE